MGVQIQGDTGNVIATKGTYSGNVTIGGTLTYEDVTNIDSVGLITARQGIEVGASPGVGASISVDGNAIFSGITTAATLKATTGIVTTLTATTGIVTSLITNTARATTGIVTTLTATTGIVTTLTTNTLTANSTTKVGSGVTLSPDGDVFATGVCTATSFSGSGANLTGISAGVLKMALKLDGTRANYAEEVDGNNFTDARNLSGLSITMTPTDATTIFLITGNIYVTHSPSFMGKGYVTTQISGGDEQMIAGNGDSSHRATFPISDGDAGTGWTGTGKTFTLFYDHNTTSAVTFRVRVATSNPSYYIFYNRDENNATDDNDGCSMISSFMVQEIDSSIFTGTDYNNIYRGT